ncbi:uncharacterized protein [Lolium perenne]|uniref:uncharacterized protein isoform X2 n=1 Tax=Lolium perenne TaxID=4522 RepID=UPI003A995571
MYIGTVDYRDLIQTKEIFCVCSRRDRRQWHLLQRREYAAPIAASTQGIWIFPFLYKEVPYAEKKSREGEIRNSCGWLAAGVLAQIRIPMYPFSYYFILRW